jgi:hypothetical protein
MGNQHNPYQTPVSDVSLNEANVKKIDLSHFDNMDNDEIKKLNKNSSDINYIGVGSILFAISSILNIYHEISVATMNLGFPIVAFLYFSISTYACFARPDWGKAVSLLSSSIFLLAFPIGTIFGVLGIRAIQRSPRLFGKDRITDTEVSEAAARIERHS